MTVTSGDVSQVYGENRIAPTFPDPTEELVAGYPLDAQSALGVSYPDREAVGKYAITLGNLENLNLNYDFKFDKEYFYYIVARHIVIVPDEDMTSVYGNTEVNIAYTSYRIPRISTTSPKKPVLSAPILSAVSSREKIPPKRA